MKTLSLIAMAILATPFLHAQTGNVGIGTITPQAKLHAIQSAGNGGAALLQLTNTNSNANALRTEQAGLGRAAFFEVINPSNNTDALLSQTAGMGAAVRGYTTGIGVAGEFEISNSGSSVGALRAYNNGSGGALEAYSLGTGRAGFFQIGSATNNSTALEVITYGTGNAGAFYGPVYMQSNSAAAGSYALRTYNSALAPLMSVTNTGNLEVSGFTQHGSGAPAIRTMKLTGTTAATDGGTTSILHGLSSSKILSVSVLVEYAPGHFIPTSYTGTTFTCNYYITSTLIGVVNVPGSSSSVLSKPMKILVTYEQ